MKWFKFLIYFALFASMSLNFIGGLSTMTGGYHTADPELLCSYYPALQILDVVAGILCMGLGVLALLARIFLANYRKAGPLLLMFLYIGVCVYDVIYAAGTYAILPQTSFNPLDLIATLIGIAPAFVMIFVNRSYFKKRSFLFVK